MTSTKSASPALSRGLVGVNILLLGVLAAVSLSPTLHAQGRREAQSRARGEYTMVSGRIVGGNANAVYVVDGANQDMIVVRWNPSTRSLDGIGYRDLTADSRSGASPTR